MTMTFSILTELEKAYDAISQADIDRAHRNLDPVEDGETVIGTVHSQEALRMWALAYVLGGIAINKASQAKFAANTEAEAIELLNRGSYYHALASLARDIFWAQAKEDLGAWSHSKVGLRQDWLLVSCEPNVIGALVAAAKRFRVESEE